MTKREASKVESGDILFANKGSDNFIINDKVIVGELIDEESWMVKCMRTQKEHYVDREDFEFKPIVR